MAARRLSLLPTECSGGLCCMGLRGAGSAGDTRHPPSPAPATLNVAARCCVCVGMCVGGRILRAAVYAADARAGMFSDDRCVRKHGVQGEHALSALRRRTCAKRFKRFLRPLGGCDDACDGGYKTKHRVIPLCVTTRRDSALSTHLRKKRAPASWQGHPPRLGVSVGSG